MTEPARRIDPLHGVTLEMMLERLVATLGWEAMGRKIAIRCFTEEPSIKSSLTFLRKTPWAREKVERLYLQTAKRHGPRGSLSSEVWKGE